MEEEKSIETQPEVPPMEQQTLAMDVTAPTSDSQQQQPDAQQVSPPDTVGSSSGVESAAISAPPGLVVPASTGPVDHMAIVSGFLREDPVFRFRLIEHLLEQNEVTAAARTQGKRYCVDVRTRSCVFC